MRIVGIVGLSYRDCLNMVSCLVDRYAQVAQLVEQWTENPRVGGSNPPLGTTFLARRTYSTCVNPLLSRAFRCVTVWVVLLVNGGTAMYVGCSGIVMLSNDGKAPDTTETIVYFGIFAMWIVLLTHLKKKWFVKPEANST